MQLNITEQDFDVICGALGKLPLENVWPVWAKLQDQGRQHVAQKRALEQAQQAGAETRESGQEAPQNQAAALVPKRKYTRKAERPGGDTGALNGSGEPAQVMG